MNALSARLVDFDPIPLVWGLSVVAVSWAIVESVKRVRRNVGRVRRIAGEDGFAYTLSFVLTVPLVMLLIAVMVETTLLLITKSGVFLATYAAARSAVVWDTAQPAGMGKARSELAAVHAMTPFASGNPIHQQGLNSHVEPGTTFAYMGLYHRYCPDGPLGDGYLLNKLVYAHHATRLEHDPPAAWDSTTTVNLRYEHPFHWRVVGRMLGHPAPWGGPTHTYTLTAKVSLQNEGAKNDAQTLGIRYDSTQ